MYGHKKRNVIFQHFEEAQGDGAAFLDGSVLFLARRFLDGLHFGVHLLVLQRVRLVHAEGHDQVPGARALLRVQAQGEVEARRHQGREAQEAQAAAGHQGTQRGRAAQY